MKASCKTKNRSNGPAAKEQRRIARKAVAPQGRAKQPKGSPKASAKSSTKTTMVF